MDNILLILAFIMLLLGLLGTVLPAIPGLPLMFGGAWLLAYLGDYQVIGGWTLAVLAVITLIGWGMDFVTGLMGAKFTGASKTALWGSAIGAVVGIFFALPGMILGPLIGAAVGEYWARRDLLNAGKVGIGTFIGFIIGVVAKIGCAVAILLTVAGMYLLHWLQTFN